MCGIVGYIGDRQATPILMDGLQRLSYRGYDSAGVATASNQGAIDLRKAKGGLENLEGLLKESPLQGRMGIGHTRWATHGEPSEVNAHPHTDTPGGIALVHNGIIENHAALRRYLEDAGQTFVSQTDTEVIVHLLHYLYKGNMLLALRKAMSMLEGSYALAVLCAAEPGALFCARKDSPLCLGMGDGEAFLASDVPALLAHTREVLFLEDMEMAVLRRESIQVFDPDGRPRQHPFFHVAWNAASAEREGFPHFMLKEIHQQPTALQTTLSSYHTQAKGHWLPLSKDEARGLTKVTIVACGTAYHAGLLGKHAIEALARIPVEAEIASEYRYRNPIVGERELVIAISQSGETADTLAALREAKSRGARVIALCNVVGSTLAREAGAADTLYTHAGPEISVASTKAYTTQGELLVMIAMALGELRGQVEEAQAARLWQQLAALPRLAEEALQSEALIKCFAGAASQQKHVFFIGRGLDYAAAMEAALKLKEVSYLFSEAYAAGELKHGPIALLEQGRLVVVLATQPHLMDKTLSNLREVKARGAQVLAICSQGLLSKVQGEVDQAIPVPDTDPLFSPLLAIIPLQLLAYSIAVARGCDVDKPRNLAKSVTVE